MAAFDSCFFFPNSVSEWGLQPRLGSVCAGAGRKRRFQKVPEGSARFRCVLVQVPEASSGRFRVPKGSGGFWRVLVQVPEAGAGSGGRFWRQVPDIFGRCRRVSEGAGGFQKVPECWQAQRFRKVWGGLEGSGEQNNAPICRFAIEKVNAHDTAMYALLLLGIPPKLIVISFQAGRGPRELKILILQAA